MQNKLRELSHKSAYCVIAGNSRGWSVCGQEAFSTPQLAERYAKKLRETFKYKTVVIPCMASIQVEDNGTFDDEIYKQMQTSYVVRLNDTYMTAYEEKTGYNDFGTKEQAKRFCNIEDAMTALADVVWGGTDKPPTIEEIVANDTEKTGREIV